MAIKSYNHAPYVRACFESVLAQTYEDFEIIATDDGSTDGTAEVIREFDDPRINFKALESNIGISGAMNATIERANGEYIAILNSDDCALPHRLQRQVDYLDTHPDVDAVFGMPKLIGEDGTPTGSSWQFRFPSEFSNAAWLRHFFFKGNCLCAPTAMVRRSAYLRAGPYDPRLINLQDFGMWVRMLVGGSNFWLSNEEMTAFRIRDGAKNASAFRRDSQLRSLYEFTHVLRWYRKLDEQALERVFFRDLESGAVSKNGKQKEVWLSELALGADFYPHRLFALDTLFETAKCQGDYKRLSDLTGKTDVFGFWSEKELREKIARLRSPLRRLMSAVQRKIRGKKSLASRQKKV